MKHCLHFIFFKEINSEYTFTLQKSISITFFTGCCGRNIFLNQRVSVFLRHEFSFQPRLFVTNPCFDHLQIFFWLKLSSSSYMSLILLQFSLSCQKFNDIPLFKPCLICRITQFWITNIFARLDNFWEIKIKYAIYQV